MSVTKFFIAFIIVIAFIFIVMIIIVDIKEFIHFIWIWNFLILGIFIINSNYNIDVITSDTIRNKDGLALSSRNNLLTKAEMKSAAKIYKALLLASELCSNNISLNEVSRKINELFIKSDIKLEYFAIRDLKTLQHANDSDLIALIAVYLGEIRLIDNIIIKSNP